MTKKRKTVRAFGGFHIEAIEAEAMHRNGIGGVPFSLFIVRAKASPEEPARRFLVIQLSDEDRKALGQIPCFVVDIEETAKGNITFAAGNSWRGDEMAYALTKFENPKTA